MPQFLESKLKAQASKKGFTGRRADRYVFGTMNAIGAMHGNQVTAKGMAMQAKHDAMVPLSRMKAKTKRKRPMMNDHDADD